MRAGRGFGMVLDGKDGQRTVAYTFDGFIIKIDMSEFDFLRIERIKIDGKAVILGSNFDFSIMQIHNGLITAMMTEFKFKGFPAKGQTEHLMTETDTEDGHFSQKFINLIEDVRHSSRVSGTV